MGYGIGTIGARYGGGAFILFLILILLVLGTPFLGGFYNVEE